MVMVIVIVMVDRDRDGDGARDDCDVMRLLGLHAKDGALGLNDVTERCHEQRSK